MKKLLIVFLFSGIYTFGFSQNLLVEFGKTFANINYNNSKGEPLEGLSPSVENSIGLGINYSLFHSSFKVGFNVNYTGYNVRGCDTVLGNFYEWDTKFISTNLNFSYEFLKFNIFQYRKEGFSLYFQTGVSTDFLVSGTQNVNNVFTDLIGVEDFSKPAFFVKASLGVNYYFSKTAFIYFQYTAGKSFLIFGDYTDQEKLRYMSHNISIGVGINLHLSKVLK